MSHDKLLKDHDCLVVVLMGHGDRYHISVCNDAKQRDDGLRYKSITDVIGMFDGANCKDLLNKPKLFLVQTCRGGEIFKITNST